MTDLDVAYLMGVAIGAFVGWALTRMWYRNK